MPIWMAFRMCSSNVNHNPRRSVFGGERSVDTLLYYYESGGETPKNHHRIFIFSFRNIADISQAWELFLNIQPNTSNHAAPFQIYSIFGIYRWRGVYRVCHMAFKALPVWRPLAALSTSTPKVRCLTSSGSAHTHGMSVE